MFISYDYYRIFYYVASCGNISQAAKVLMSSQPNMTRAIKNLEAELNCQLFLRTNRCMQLTPEGEKLYSHVKIAFEHIEAGEEEINEANSLLSGTVFIAASEVALRCLLLPVLKKYRLMYPDVHIRISNHSTPQAIKVISDGSADFAVVTTPTPVLQGLKKTDVKTVREIAVCPDNFIKLKGPGIRLAQLQQYPLISLGTGTMSIELYRDFFSSHGLAFTPDIEAATADQILPMVEADLGIGFVPEEFLRDSQNVIKIELEEKLPERKICIIKRKEQPLSVAAKKLEQMILDTVSL